MTLASGGCVPLCASYLERPCPGLLQPPPSLCPWVCSDQPSAQRPHFFQGQRRLSAHQWPPDGKKPSHQAGHLLLCYSRSPELPIVKGGLSSRLISPIHTDVEYCLDGPAQCWSLPPTSGGVGPTLSAGDLGLGVEGSMALWWVFAKAGSASSCQWFRLPPNTCVEWGGGLPCRLGLFMSKSLGMAAGDAPLLRESDCRSSIPLLLPVSLSWSPCDLNVKS